MANNGIIVGGVIATAAIIFAVFVSFNAITDNGTGELIVTNGNHAETIGETIGVVKSYDYSLIDIFEKSEESVVQVNVLRGESDGGMGSGFVYSEDGYVITNQHVVRDAQKVTVTFLDGESYIGEVIGTAQDLDIAVVKVSPSNTYLQPIKIGDSSKLKVGERIAAIGNPFGLSGSMTSGIVSQIGRLLPQESGYSIPDVIQTDAAINPGNSGGPLINMKGEVVGINTAIQSATGEFSGIGFAVPSNTVKKVVPVLIENGEFKHPWMGISGTDVDPELAEVRGLKSSKGFLVVSVIEESPAELAGLLGVTETKEMDGREFALDGDIILAIDGKTVRKISDILVHLQREKSIGDDMVLSVNRNGEMLELTMVLEERPR
ncbi:MAG: trypsin-like serine protease [Thaumarchaeota archaeon]|nr:trypsin-like serine protease [Nitrososphaerota archaeon]MBT4057049.1 trypsin-like serine protease [Nitrososphaerota archaeon]MBT4175680.1 trypsin-like serine protease [Nitrososphaerota archaeon]MBT4509960.1 trypsin-like serine protease [Nitrososphaerota archaeon]MBT4676120.1 trypsin-like serine protease [Nitrososphaerota archaeon]